MPFRRISRKDLLAGCSETGAGDGLDPRYDRPESPAKVANRKALQLCGQVAETLMLVLAGASGDEVLRHLVVKSVVPAPNTSRLLVTVAPSAVAPTVDLDAVRGQLEQVRGRLRGEIAAAIHRRRVPDLTFRVVRQ
jgi:ribosome-binding factor A